MDRVSWNWILNGLDEALEFCRRLRLGERFEGGRFGKYRVWVAELVSALKTGGQEGARAAFNDHPARSSTALTESFELADILPFARSLAPEIIKRRLMKILLGPARPADETTNTNEARNILFELTMASKLWRAGLVPELVEPDIRCQVGGRAVYVACERPFSEKSARQAYTDALGQIADVLKEAPAEARGVVALSLTRLFNPGDRFLKHENEEVGKRYLSSEMGRLAQEMISTTDWPPPPAGTMGILWHVITAGFDRSQALIVAAQQLNVQPTRPADELLLKALFGKLRAMGDSKGQP